jgi:hypothetical protein
MFDLLYSLITSFFDDHLTGDLVFTLVVGIAATSLVAWMVWDTIKILRK